MTIVQGKTTKKQVLDTLGAPNDYNSTVYRYNAPSNKVEYIDITYIEEDGTKWNFCLSQRPECKGFFSVHLDRSTGKVKRMRF